MKHLLQTGLLLCLALAGTSLRGALEFSAFIVLPRSELFVLRDLEQDQTSGWLPLGQSFRGYTLKSFDPMREVITLEKGGKTIDLRLKDSKVRDGGGVVGPAEPSPAGVGRTVGSPSGHSNKVIGRIVVKDDGGLYFDGRKTTLIQLDALLNTIKEQKGVIHYYYDAPSREATQVADAAMSAALAKRIPIKRFTNENLTEYLGLLDGKVHKFEPAK